MYNPIKYLLVKVCVFLLPLFVFAELAGYIGDSGLKKTKFIDYKMWSRLEEDKNVNADLLIMGNSRASCHINPDILDSILPVHSYNLGLHAGILPLQFHIWRLYIKRNQKPRTIVWNVDWGTLSDEHDLSVRKPHYLPWCNDPDWKPIIEKAGFSFFDKYIPCWKYVGRSELLVKGFKEYTGISESDYGVPFILSYRRGYVRVDDRQPKQKWILRHEFKTGNFDATEDFLRMCRREKIQVIFYYSPVYAPFRESFEPYIITYPAIDSLAKAWNIPFLDYSRVPESSDSTLFKDDIHLNGKGADWLSRRLGHDVDSLLSEMKTRL